jgi:hypothetical protein
MILRKDVLVLVIAGILQVVLFSSVQYLLVLQNAGNSGGLVIYLLSIPVQLWLLSQVFFRRSISPRLANRIIAFYIASWVVGFISIVWVYFKWGGRF